MNIPAGSFPRDRPMIISAQVLREKTGRLAVIVRSGQLTAESPETERGWNDWNVKELSGILKKPKSVAGTQRGIDLVLLAGEY